MQERLHPVLQAHYDFGEAEMEWILYPSAETAMELEDRRVDYLNICAEYGVEPVEGAVL